MVLRVAFYTALIGFAFFIRWVDSAPLAAAFAFSLTHHFVHLLLKEHRKQRENDEGVHPALREYYRNA